MLTTPPRDREIWRLAGPAFVALVAEPLFLLADSAIVGHLGGVPLAGLALAGAVLTTAVSMCVFLAYGTTGSVARMLGAGDLRGALATGIDGLWLAVVIGGVAWAVLTPLARPVVRLFGADGSVAEQATRYLVIALAGLVPLLLMLAATGVLRGLQDTRTPLVVAVIGNAANVVLNVVLVYPAGLGIAGSALGSLIAQAGSAAALVAIVVRAARRHGVRLTPSAYGIHRAGRAGVPLLLRTITLRAALLLMTYGATRLGTTDLATMQLALTIWGFLAMALDALAIAAQALTGRYLGSGDADRTRAVTDRMTRLGVVSGVVTGVGLALVAPVVGPLFTNDVGMLRELPVVLLIAAAAQPVAGVVFVLDGVLIGAGDGRYLAWAGLLVLAVFAPFAWAAVGWVGSLGWLWAAFAVAFMGGRCVVLVARARGRTWMRLGVS